MVSLGAYMGWMIIWLSVFAAMGENDAPGTQLNKFSNAFWYGVVTSSTVGYGDYAPYSNECNEDTYAPTVAPTMMDLVNGSNMMVVGNYSNNNSVILNTPSPTTGLECEEDGTWSNGLIIFVCLWSLLGVIFNLLLVGLFEQLYSYFIHWVIYWCFCSKGKCCGDYYDYWLEMKIFVLQNAMYNIHTNGVDRMEYTLPQQFNNNIVWHYKPKQVEDLFVGR